MEKQPISLESKAIRKARNIPNFVSGIGLSIILASEIACANEPMTPTNDTLATTPSTSEPPAWLTTPTPNTLSLEFSTPEHINILNKYYPELIRSGLAIKDQVSTTNNSKSSTIYNYTEYQLNVDSSYAIVYDLLESYAHFSQAKISYPLSDNKRVFVISPRQEANNRILLLIPANAPKPARLKTRIKTVSESNAATQLIVGGALSYVQVTTEGNDELFPSIKQQATKGFAIEACQQVINTTVLNTKGTEIKNLQESYYAQEIFCNSFGVAITSRLLGIPYDTYRSFATSHSLNLKSKNKYPLIIFDKRTYSQFPITGGILK